MVQCKTNLGHSFAANTGQFSGMGFVQTNKKKTTLDQYLDILQFYIIFIHTHFLMLIYLIYTICVPLNGAKILHFSSGALQGHLQLSDCNGVAKTIPAPQI